MINKTVKDSYLRAVREQHKKILVTVSNLTLNQVEFKDLNDHSFDDFRDFIWASSNFVPFMSLLIKE